MIPYEIDPSLHAAQPEPVHLGDGFSPPPDAAAPAEATAPVATAPGDDRTAWMLGDKSAF